MNGTLEVMLVPVGGEPYPKTLHADERGSFLHELQGCVGGLIEPMSYVFDDAPAVYCNEEGVLGASIETANRAIYATSEMTSKGYLSQMDYSHVVREGELYSIAFGDLVCVGFDAETGESRDISAEERERVLERFGGAESIESGKAAVLRVLASKALR